MKGGFISLLRTLFQGNKKLLFLLALNLILAFLYFQRQKLKKQAKLQQKLEANILKVRLLLKELAIEANFALNYTYLKYKEKALLNKDQKKLLIIEEFNQIIL